MDPLLHTAIALTLMIATYVWGRARAYNAYAVDITNNAVAATINTLEQEGYLKVVYDENGVKGYLQVAETDQN